MKCFMFSGGMDSLIGSFLVNCNNLVYVRLGHRYEAMELQASNRLAQAMGASLTVLFGPDLGRFEEPSAYIPGRNLALAYMGALLHNTVYMSLQKGERDLSDRSVEFCTAASKALSIAMDRPIEVITPVADLYKDEMVSRYLELGGPVLWLKYAWSCYSSLGVECGECKACVRRYLALVSNDINCLDWFARDPRKSRASQKYLAHLDRYDVHRQELIIRYLEG